jgi:hypothetical protein
LDAATTNAAIHVWPIGYSRFLQLLHAFTSSDTALVFVQHILLEAGALYLTFTLLYIFKPSKTVANSLLFFIFVNPLLLWISNYVSSDALFAALSLVWSAQLLWILYRPKPYDMWLQVLTLFFAFTVRYNALYYPFVAAVVLLHSRISWSLKIASIGLSVLLIGGFIWHSSNKYQNLTGDRQFSAFSGWQIASNALFMYSHIDNHNDIPTPQFEMLHQITCKHIDSLKYLKSRPDSILGIYYLWDKKAPLQKYMEIKYSVGINSAMHFKEWASLSKFYATYGTYLIRQHPFSYVKYYILPNIVNYYVPPVEILNHYNIEGDHVRSLAQIWFEYPNTRITGFSKETKILKWHSILVTLVNCLFLYSAVMFIALKKYKQADCPFKIGFILVVGIWLANFSFSILASPIVLRYQLFPMTLYLLYGVILFEYLFKTDNYTVR